MKISFIVILSLIAFLSSRAYAVKEHATTQPGVEEETTRGSLRENATSFPNAKIIDSNVKDEKNHLKESNEVSAIGERIVHQEQGNTITAYSQAKDHVLKENLPQIIQAVYANNLSNFEATLKIINKFRDQFHLYKGYEALLNEMNKNNHLNNSKIIKLAYHVKKVIEENEEFQVYNTSKTRYVGLLKNLLRRFPHSLIQLLSNKLCTLKNTQWNEYLYAENNSYNYDKDRGRIFTWQPGYKPCKSYFILEPDYDGDYFYIKSDAWEHYIFAASKSFNFDTERRRVFTWKQGDKLSESRWVVEYQGDQNYAIKNLHDEYLYAAGDYFNYDSERRRVFTWIPGNRDGQDVWKLQCR